MRTLLPLLTATLLASFALAQSAPPPSAEVRLAVDSGFLHNASAKEQVVFRHTVSFGVTEWLRIHFGKDVSLPAGSRVLLTATRDRARQRLDAAALADWDGSSAFFNGGDVVVELVAGPNTRGNRLTLDGVTRGIVPFGPESICGNVDDRVRSNDPRQGRLSSGCTGWMIGPDVMLTAGHCGATNSTGVYEMNVPLSQSNGTVVRAHPDDQYPYRVLDSLNSGVGSDWGVCRMGRNSNHGQLPTERNNGQWYTLGSIPAGTAGQDIRITGYGTTSPRNSLSQVQKTHVGPLAQINTTSLCYRPDTTGGNSGSPVVHENTGLAIGIHTHGGCTSSGGCNSGTRIDRGDLQQAINNASPGRAGFFPYGVGCPQPPVFYEEFTAGNDLTGLSFRMTPNAGGGYDVTACTASCFDASFAGNLNLSDDQLARNLALGFSIPLPGTGQTTNAIDVDSNGWIGLIAGQHTGSDFTESVAEFLAEPARLAVWWDDLNPSRGGAVYFDQRPGKAMVTWSGVPEFSATGSNTMQVQFFATGEILVHFAAGNTSTDGLFGYSPGSVSSDPGALDVSGAVPFSTTGAGQPLRLSASALPVIGQIAQLELTDLPAATSFAWLFLGFAQVNRDLAVIGMPGCVQRTELDVSFGMAFRQGGAVLSVPVPNDPSLVGQSVFSQGVALAPGANRLGVVASNGGELRLGN